MAQATHFLGSQRHFAYMAYLNMARIVDSLLNFKARQKKIFKAILPSKSIAHVSANFSRQLSAAKWQSERQIIFCWSSLSLTVRENSQSAFVEYVASGAK